MDANEEVLFIFFQLASICVRSRLKNLHPHVPNLQSLEIENGHMLSKHQTPVAASAPVAEHLLTSGMPAAGLGTMPGLPELPDDFEAPPGYQSMASSVPFSFRVWKSFMAGIDQADRLMVSDSHMAEYPPGPSTTPVLPAGQAMRGVRSRP